MKEEILKPPKTKEEILKQLYITAEDLRILMPIGKVKAIQAINEIREEMIEKGYYIPQTKTHLALTKMVKKKYGFE